MSKTNFNVGVRNAYKQREREIKVKGELKNINNFLTSGTYAYNDFKAIIQNNTLKVSGSTNTNNFGTSLVQNFEVPSGEYAFELKRKKGNHAITIGLTYNIDENNFDSIEVSSNNPKQVKTIESNVIFNGINFAFESNTEYDDEFELILYNVNDNFDFIIGENTRLSKNLLPLFNYSQTLDENRMFKVEGNTYTFKSNDSMWGSGFPSTMSFTLQAGTYTFSITPTSSEQYNWVIFWIDYTTNNTTEQFSIGTARGEHSTITKTFSEETTIKINQFSFACWSENVITINYNFMINEGSVALPYEEYGQIIDISVCEILDFEVDEKSDIYYESMPMVEMTIDVDNTEGYFSDFTESSITDKLNKNCYIDLFLNVNDTGWVKAWTMQFDGLKATNEKATLTFKPYCMSIYDKMIYDINKNFRNSAFTWNYVKDIFSSNYGVTMQTSQQPNVAVVINQYTPLETISDFLIFCLSFVSRQNTTPQLLAIRDNDILKYCYINNEYSNEEIYDDGENDSLILEKPIITKETLEGVIETHTDIISYTSVSDTYNFQKEITSTLRNTKDVLIIYGEEFNLSGISSSNITITGATLDNLAVSIPAGSEGSHYLILQISGTKGNNYSITINANLMRQKEIKTTQKIYARNKYEDTKNFININTNKILGNGYYWESLVDKLTKKIKLKIKALPYLQVGDILYVDGIGNIVIAEINTSWSGGFIMEITAYYYDLN